ncbi:MAG TPA: preprotein translocase subunit YajC [Patescibacteria group bacterium]|nr:preprotein translocase subunit YajC [Patescibacteria group bacterium]
MFPLIAKAYAAGTGAATGAQAPAPATSDAAAANTVIADAPGQGEALMLNLLLIAILVGLFYVLLIIPQQKRFKKHRTMIDTMKKGDRVLTSAGFIGTIDKIEAGEDEIVIDLGNGLKVTALRSSIQSMMKDKDKKKASEVLAEAEQEAKEKKVANKK